MARRQEAHEYYLKKRFPSLSDEQLQRQAREYVKFVTKWTTDKGPNGFATNPPNAAVTVFQPDGAKTGLKSVGSSVHP